MIRQKLPPPTIHTPDRGQTRRSSDLGRRGPDRAAPACGQTRAIGRSTTLDELKIGLLGGTLSAATLNKPRSAATYLKDGSGEAHLDGVLDEIELRVEVEIAKLSVR